MQNRIQNNLCISRVSKKRKTISRYRCYHVRIIGDDDMAQTIHMTVLRRGWKTQAIEKNQQNKGINATGLRIPAYMAFFIPNSGRDRPDISPIGRVVSIGRT